MSSFLFFPFFFCQQCVPSIKQRAKPGRLYSWSGTTDCFGESTWDHLRQCWGLAKVLSMVSVFLPHNLFLPEPSSGGRNRWWCWTIRSWPSKLKGWWRPGTRGRRAWPQPQGSGQPIPTLSFLLRFSSSAKWSTASWLSPRKKSCLTCSWRTFLTTSTILTTFPSTWTQSTWPSLKRSSVWAGMRLLGFGGSSTPTSNKVAWLLGWDRWWWKMWFSIFWWKLWSTNFVQVSRVNHSCGPKCEVVWNAEYRSLDIRLRKLIRRSLTSRRAVLAVEEGEEVTVNCLAVSDGLSRSVRQRSLQKIYGWETGDYQLVINAIWRFSCTCSTCLLLGEHLRQEEDVRSELMRQHHLLQVSNRCWGKEGNRWSNSGGGGASWNTEKDQGDAQASQVRGNSAQYSLHINWGKN